MNKVLLVVLTIIGYCLMAFVTTILLLYIDRAEGRHANKVYSGYSDYVIIGFLWIFILPFVLGYLIYVGAKALAISIVETMVAKKTIEETKDEPSKDKNKDNCCD